MKAVLIESGPYDVWEMMGDTPSELIPQAERVWAGYAAKDRKRVSVYVCLVEDDYGTEDDFGYIRADIQRIVWMNGAYRGGSA